MAIVTISRKCGTGAREIAKTVAKRLQFEFVSKDSIYKEIEEHGKKWLGWVARLDDHAPTLWERYDQSHAAYRVLEAMCEEGLDTKAARVTVEVRFGQEVPEILASVRKFEPELLVMGAKGHYATAASPLGNVARKLIDHAPCSVLIVRPSGQEFPGPISH